MKNNEDIIRNFYEHIVSDNLLGHLEDFVSEECTVWADGKSEKVGVNGMKEHLEAIRHTYPDYRMRILRQFVSGDYVISEFRMEGTFQNEWLGINPTGEKLSITGIDIDKIVDGKIVEHSGAANTFEAFWAMNLIGPTSKHLIKES